MDSYIEIKQEIEKLEKSLSSKNQERNDLLLPMFKIIEDNGLNNVLPSNLDNYLPKNLPLRLTILAEEVELNNLSNKTILLGEIEDARRKVIEKNNEQIIEIQRLDSMRTKLEERRNYVLSRMPELDELDNQVARLQTGIDRRLNILNTVSLEPEEQKVIRDIIAKSIEQVQELNGKKDEILSEKGLYSDVVELKKEINPNKEEKIEDNHKEIRNVNSASDEFYKRVQELNGSLSSIENDLDEYKKRILNHDYPERQPLRVRPVNNSQEEVINSSDNSQEFFRPASDLGIDTDSKEESRLKSTIRTLNNIESSERKEDSKTFLGFRPATDLDTKEETNLESIAKKTNSKEQSTKNDQNTFGFKPATDLDSSVKASDEIAIGVPYTYKFEEVKDESKPLESKFFRPASSLDANIETKEEPKEKSGVYQKIQDLPGVSKDLIGKWVIKKDGKYIDIDKIKNPDPDQAILVLPNDAIIDYEKGTYELPNDNGIQNDYKEDDSLNEEELKVEESHSNASLGTKIKTKKSLRAILGLNTIIEKIRERKAKIKAKKEQENQTDSRGFGESFYALLTPPDKRIIEEARNNIEAARLLLEEHLEELTEEEREKISNNLSRIYLKLNQARNNKNHQRDDLYNQNIEELKIISDELAKDIKPQHKKVKTR